MRRPRSCRRHDSRPPTRITGGRRSCSRSSRSTPSRAPRAAGSCAHRVPHPAVLHRPYPHTPPHARVHGRASRCAKCPVDPPTVRTGRRATTRGNPSRPLSHTPTPDHVRGRLVWALVLHVPQIGPRRHRPSTGTSVLTTTRRASGRRARGMTPPPVGRRSRGRRSRQILDRHRLEPLSRLSLREERPSE